MPELLDQLDILGRAGATIVAAIPSCTLVPLPVSLLLTRRFRREELLKRIHWMVPWAAFCRRFIAGIDLSVENRHLLPARTRGHMFICNHQSWVDILVLIESLNTIAFMSKSLVKYIPLIGQCAYAGGTVFIERGKEGSRRHALRETIQMCRESTAVVVFPEGTRSVDGNLCEKIHHGSIVAARAEGLKVIPVGLDGSHRVLSKNMDRFNTGHRVAVTIGAPLDSGDFGSDDSWIDGVWGQVKSLHEASRARIRTTICS